MKKTILFALIAILFLAMFTGCRAYRRTAYTAPGGYEVTNTDGRTTQGFQYRNDGYPSGGNVNRGAHHSRHDGYRHYRHDGLVTDTDGIIGNGTFADRPATNGHNSTIRPGVGGMDGAARGGAVMPGTETNR